MIYERPAVDAPIDQGDIVTECPLVAITSIPPNPGTPPSVHCEYARVLVISQTCDLANEKTTLVNVAEVFDATSLVESGTLKPADVKGPIRAGRVWGWYFLPADSELVLPEMVVNLRRLHTVRLEFLLALCLAGKRAARVRPLYREHLAKHFADTFCRIGLPKPFETM